MAQAERDALASERVDDNEVEMRTRILEQQTGGATPWSSWSRYVTQSGVGPVGGMLEAVAMSVRHSILPGYTAMSRVQRVVETADGRPVRTVEYEFRTMSDGRLREKLRRADEALAAGNTRSAEEYFAELGAEKPHGEFIEAVTRLVAWFDSANSNPEKPLDWAALSAETNEVRRHEADGHRMVVWRSAAGKEYRLIVASHDPPDGEFTFDFQDGQGLVCTNLTIPAANAVRWALQVVRDKRAPDGRGRR